MVAAAEEFAANLQQLCLSNGGTITVHDIETQLHAFKESNSVHQAAASAFDFCTEARSNDVLKLIEHDGFAAYFIFRRYHDQTDRTFRVQIARAKRWRIEFSKALIKCSRVVFELDIEAATTTAYRRKSAEDGASLQLATVLTEPDVQDAMRLLDTALQDTVKNGTLLRRTCSEINDHLCSAFDVTQPSVLLVSEPQFVSFSNALDRAG